jgi:hypothetical protein
MHVVTRVPNKSHPLPIARQVVGFSRRVDAEQELVSVVRVVEERAAEGPSP